MDNLLSLETNFITNFIASTLVSPKFVPFHETNPSSSSSFLIKLQLTSHDHLLMLLSGKKALAIISR